MRHNINNSEKILQEMRYIGKRIAILASSVREYGCKKATNQYYEEHFTLFKPDSPQNCQLLDENGCLLAVNDAWLETMRYTREEVIGRWFGDYLYPHDVSLFTNNLLCVGRIGELDMIVVRLVRNDGSIIAVSLKAVISLDDYGILRQIHCAFEDITDFIRFDVLINNQEEHVLLAGKAT